MARKIMDDVAEKNRHVVKHFKDLSKGSRFMFRKRPDLYSDYILGCFQNEEDNLTLYFVIDTYSGDVFGADSVSPFEEVVLMKR